MKCRFIQKLQMRIHASTSNWYLRKEYLGQDVHNSLLRLKDCTIAITTILTTTDLCVNTVGILFNFTQSIFHKFSILYSAFELFHH